MPRTWSLKQNFSLEKATWVILAGVFGLTPIFFLPISWLSLLGSKELWLLIGAFIIFILLWVKFFQAGQVVWPKNHLLTAGGVLFLIFVLSGIFSLTNRSWISDFNILNSVAVWGFLLFFFVASMFLANKKDRIWTLFILWGLSTVVMVVFQLIRFFTGWSFGGWFPLLSFTTIGSWYGSGVFLGGLLVTSVAWLEFLPQGSRAKIWAWAFAFIGLVGVVLAGTIWLWLMLLVFGILILCYRLIASDKGEESNSFSIRRPSLLLIFIALLLVILGWSNNGWLRSNLDNFLQSNNLAALDVKPGISISSKILWETWKTRPVLGTGPGTYDLVWQKSKPSEILPTQFWSASFPYAFNFPFTLAVELGILGLLAWLVFSLIFFGTGIVFLASKKTNLENGFPVAIVFSAALYFWIQSLFNNLDLTSWLYFFVFAGAMLGLIVAQWGKTGWWILDFKKKQKWQLPILFSFIFSGVVVLAAGIYLSVQFGANYLLSKAASAFNRGDFVKSEEFLIQAMRLKQNDNFYRSLVELKIAELNSILPLAESDKAKFQEQAKILLDSAIFAGQKMVELEPADYHNWLYLANFYGSLSAPPLSIPGSYDKSQEYFAEALKRAPNQPDIFVTQAKIEISSNRLESAEKLFKKALELKNNYAEAYLGLAQIFELAGKKDKVLEYLGLAFNADPSNQDIAFQFGYYLYQAGKFTDSAKLLGSLVAVAPGNANARYFLALSLSKIGQQETALAHFEQLAKDNPTNQELSKIIANLRAGREPLATPKVSVPPKTKTGVKK